jgi:hypothetical protein
MHPVDVSLCFIIHAELRMCTASHKDLCSRPLSLANFQNCTSVIGKLSITDSESVVLKSGCFLGCIIETFLQGMWLICYALEYSKLIEIAHLTDFKAISNVIT